MPKKQKEEPKPGMTKACLSLQESGRLVKFYRRAIPEMSAEKQVNDYSSPVCYAHLREFREGF